MDKASPERYHPLLEYIFFGNYFYGLCAVALSVEATLQQRYPLNGWLYFFFVFIASVLYYSYPYIRKLPVSNSNRRTNWYTEYFTVMWWNQIIITVILSVALIMFLKDYWKAVLDMSAVHWLLIFIFPAVAALYYGINSLPRKYNLRKIGWLKPFIIGFTWAGLVNVYPILFYDITHHRQYSTDLIGALLFIKNFMFVTVLCIMFDVKDYSTDYVSRLKTFVVELGLRKTIVYILLPLTVLGFGTFIWYAVTHQFHPMKILLNVVPFVLLFIVSLSMFRRRSLMYYLVVVDGLMLIKAICGTIAMLFF